jgi:hypothetical protein
MGKLLIFLVRLPIDVVMLTADLIELTRWRFVAMMSGLIGVMGPRSGPFCRRRWRSVSVSGQNCMLCGHAQRYANRFVFSLLCPWASTLSVSGLGRAVACRRENGFRVRPVRYTCAAMLVGAFWIVVVEALYHCLI